MTNNDDISCHRRLNIHQNEIFLNGNGYLEANMDSEKRFKTKTGYCHILPDKIVLTRDGIVGNISKVIAGNNIARILLIYSGLVVALLYLVYDGYTNGQRIQPTILGMIAAYLFFNIFGSLNNSATPIIDRTKITKIRFKNGIQGVTRARFEVSFENEDGKLKKRLIMLPGSFSNGRSETEKALKIMTEEKLIHMESR